MTAFLLFLVIFAVDFGEKVNQLLFDVAVEVFLLVELGVHQLCPDEVDEVLLEVEGAVLPTVTIEDPEDRDLDPI